LALEQNGSDRLIRRYVVGLDVVSMATRSDTSYFHYDGLGSVTNVTSSTGAPLWAYQYEPFGTPRAETQSSRKSPDNPLRFAGQYLDGETGLYHLRARQYDSVTGRFLSLDPVAQPDDEPGVAPYVYVGDRPTVFTDPNGLCPTCVAAGFGAAWEGGWYSLNTAVGPGDFTFRGLGASMVGGAVSSGGGKFFGKYVEDLGLSGAKKLLSKLGLAAGASTAGAVAKQGVCERLPTLRELAAANASGLFAASIPSAKPAHGFLPYKLKGLLNLSKTNTKVFWHEQMNKKVWGTAVGTIASPSSRPCK
jgi:RHS repeat-associated protein